MQLDRWCYRTLDFFYAWAIGLCFLLCFFKILWLFLFYLDIN